TSFGRPKDSVWSDWSSLGEPNIWRTCARVVSSGANPRHDFAKQGADANATKAVTLTEYRISFIGSDITFELTRRRESKHPWPHQASCETRPRRSRPTICYAADLRSDGT